MKTETYKTYGMQEDYETEDMVMGPKPVPKTTKDPVKKVDPKPAAPAKTPATKTPVAAPTAKDTKKPEPPKTVTPAAAAKTAASKTPTVAPAAKDAKKVEPPKGKDPVK